MLLAAGADPDIAATRHDLTPLHRASERGDGVSVRALLAAGADPNARDAAYGLTPFLASIVKSAHNAAMLVFMDPPRVEIPSARRSGGGGGRLRVDLRARDNAGNTALMIAMRRTSPPELTRAFRIALLRTGADPDASNRKGCSALMYASVAKAPAEVSALLAAGADPNKASSPPHSTTAILCALMRRRDDVQGTRQILRALLDAGADPNVVDSDGRTPLMYAVHGGDLEMVSLLIDANADIGRVANDGAESAQKIAVENGFVDISRALVSVVGGRLE
jgi:ankyrin repeat protein